MDIIGIGESDVDLFLRVKRLPGRGEKVRAEEIGRLPGGIIGNFCSQAVKTGVSCGIVTVVGDDENGRIIREDYKNRGIDTTGLAVDYEEKTFYCVVFLDEGGEKYLSAVVTPLISPPVAKIPWEYVRQAGYVHLCSMNYALAAAAAGEIRGSRTRLSLDYEAHADGGGLENWKPILECVSVLFTNEEGICQLYPSLSIEEAAKDLAAWGPDLVVVTCADKGGFVYDGKRLHRYRAFQPERLLDTTGAGDCFNAAFLSALIKGMEIGMAADYAAAAASFVIGEVGARTGQKDDRAIRKFLDSSPKKL